MLKNKKSFGAWENLELWLRLQLQGRSDSGVLWALALPLDPCLLYMTSTCLYLCLFISEYLDSNIPEILKLVGISGLCSIPLHNSYL